MGHWFECARVTAGWGGRLLVPQALFSGTWLIDWNAAHLKGLGAYLNVQVYCRDPGLCPRIIPSRDSTAAGQAASPRFAITELSRLRAWLR